MRFVVSVNSLLDVKENQRETIFFLASSFLSPALFLFLFLPNLCLKRKELSICSPPCLFRTFCLCVVNKEDSLSQKWTFFSTLLFVISLQDDDEEERYLCPHHHLDIHTASCLCRTKKIMRDVGEGRPPGRISRSDKDVEKLSRRFANLTPVASGSGASSGEPSQYEAGTSDYARALNGYQHNVRDGAQGTSGYARPGTSLVTSASPIMSTFMTSSAIPSAPPEEEEEEEEVVWVRRDEVNQEPLLKKSKNQVSSYKTPQPYRNQSFDEIISSPEETRHPRPRDVTSSRRPQTPPTSVHHRRGILKRGGRPRDHSAEARSKHQNDQFAKLVAKTCRREQSLALRKETVVEWQTIATVIDRLLFWVFLLATIAAYLVILVFVPMTKPDFPKDIPNVHAFIRSGPHS